MTTEPETRAPHPAGASLEAAFAKQSKKAANKTTTYALYLNEDDLGAVIEAAGESLTDALFPVNLDAGDLVYLGEFSGNTREAAVEKMLSRDFVASDGRIDAVRTAHEAHVDLEFIGIPVSYRVSVPVLWERTPVRKIGR